MYVLYDTRTVPPPDRFEYARAGSASELAPMALRGRAPGRLLAVMSVVEIGDFVIEAPTWAADSELAGHRTDRLIRACDPECYRIYLSVNGGVRVEQADSQIAFRARDIALYDMSCPAVATHPTGSPMKVVMLSFPRALVPVTRAAIRPLLGTVMPRNLPGLSLIAELLTGLTGLAGTATTAGQEADPHLADVLRECTAGLIRQWLGQPDGVTPRTRQLLRTARIRTIIGQHLGDPGLGPDQIAKAANISPRYLHKLFQDTELTPMQMVKRLRLEACRRRLEDAALTATPIKDIIAMHGYLRPDQFARDFKELFGVSASQVRQPTSRRLSRSEG